MRDYDPEAWADAVSVDAAIRTGFRGIRGEVYLHRSAVQLDRADLTTAADRAVSSISDRMNARACAASDPPEIRRSAKPDFRLCDIPVLRFYSAVPLGAEGGACVGRVGMKRLAPLPRQVSSSPAPTRTCEFPRIRLSTRGCSHGWPSQFFEGVGRFPKLVGSLVEAFVWVVPSVRHA